MRLFGQPFFLCLYPRSRLHLHNILADRRVHTKIRTSSREVAMPIELPRGYFRVIHPAPVTFQIVVHGLPTPLTLPQPVSHSSATSFPSSFSTIPRHHSCVCPPRPLLHPKTPTSQQAVSFLPTTQNATVVQVLEFPELSLPLEEEEPLLLLLLCSCSFRRAPCRFCHRFCAACQHAISFTSPACGPSASLERSPEQNPRRHFRRPA